jgi:hypothetical protein
MSPESFRGSAASVRVCSVNCGEKQATAVNFSTWLVANRVRLAITALAAIACPAIVHRAIFARLLARGLVRRQRRRANNGRDDGTHNFGVSLHINVNRLRHSKLRGKNAITRNDFELPPS